MLARSLGGLPNFPISTIRSCRLQHDDKRVPAAGPHAYKSCPPISLTVPVSNLASDVRRTCTTKLVASVDWQSVSKASACKQSPMMKQ